MRFDGSDLLIALGFVAVLIGLWWLLPAATLIVGGLGLMMVGGLRAARTRPVAPGRAQPDEGS